jgi:hypothetical protein
MESNSQLMQDIFALTVSKNKTYIEIGAYLPIKSNNTFLLEQQGWKGFSLELDKESKELLWLNEKQRKNQIYWENALTFDYAKALKENDLPMHLGYLSCDIEPPINTFNALKRTIEQGISFDCITFEHDKYCSEIDYDPIVTEYLTKHGYKVAVNDVYRIRKYKVEGQKKKEHRKCSMETWFVHESIDFKTMSFDAWRQSLNL